MPQLAAFYFGPTPVSVLHGEQIVNLYRAFVSVEHRDKVVALSEIKEEVWTLNISRYVLPPIGEDNRNTFYAFGAVEDENGYLSRYGFEESIRDGATKELHFDPRLIEKLFSC
jgi:type I restriction-modification system DNA methylase subunit